MRLRTEVHGDTPIRLPLVLQDLSCQIALDYPYLNDIREDMSIDQCIHHLFGASTVAADVLVSEYGRYFGNPASWVPGVPHALRDDRNTVHDFWV